jgi:mono/diheme cytochrome c family protein
MAGLFERSVVEVSANTPLTPEQMKGLVERGRYLARAADCAACHTAPGGTPLAGGLAFPMPFGTLCDTNITLDPKTGIGRWTRARSSARCATAPHGHLYPAMSYVSYRQLTAADTDAIYAYLMSRLPICQADHANGFPFDYVRPTLAPACASPRRATCSSSSPVACPSEPCPAASAPAHAGLQPPAGRPPDRRPRDLAARHLGRPSPGRDPGRGARGALDDPVGSIAPCSSR